MDKYIIIPKSLMPTALQYIEDHSDITWSGHCKPTQYFGWDVYGCDNIMLLRRVCNDMRMTWNYPDLANQSYGFNHLSEFIK